MSKINGRLLTEIKERRQRASAMGKTVQELELERYEVTIEFKQALSPREGKTRKEAMNDLKRQARALNSRVINVLASMGVTDYQVLPLSNSIKTSITIEQIKEISKHPDVKIVRLVKPEKVLT